MNTTMNNDEKTCAHSSVSKRKEAKGIYNGEPVTLVQTTKGGVIIVSASTWDLRDWLGYSSNVSLDSNGGRHVYPRITAVSFDPKQCRPEPYTLQRLLLAIITVEKEMAGELVPMAAQGFVARTKNGNSCDLQDGNLEWVKSDGKRNTFRVLHDVRERWRIAASGGNPNAVFAEKRRNADANAKSLAAAIREPIGGERKEIPPRAHVNL